MVGGHNNIDHILALLSFLQLQVGFICLAFLFFFPALFSCTPVTLNDIGYGIYLPVTNDQRKKCLVNDVILYSNMVQLVLAYRQNE